MKDKKFLDFTRNKYFYGKMLSVDDFVTEQDYFNNKRRVINRLLFGCGVVCGFNIEQNPDYSYYVTKGFALDGRGREIFLDRDTKPALDALYAEYKSRVGSTGRFSQTMYLCMEYAETFERPVYSLAESGGTPNFSRCVEGCGFSLTDAPPPKNNLVSEILKDELIVYEDNCVCVRLFSPGYVNPLEDFKIFLDFELYGTAVDYGFWCKLSLKGATHKGASEIRFDLNGKKESSVHEFVLSAEAGRRIEILSHDARLRLGGSVFGIKDFRAETDIISENIDEVLFRDCAYIETNDALAEDSGLVYLARVFVTEERGKVSFGELQSLRERRNVYGTAMAYLESRNRRYRVSKGSIAPQPIEPPAPVPVVQQIKSGSVVIDIDKHNKAGDLFYSKETAHGLGYGNVCVSIGKRDGDCMVFGGDDIFVENIHIVTGVKVNIRNGSFVVGIRLLKETDVQNLRLNWFAFKDGTVPEPGISGIQIIPAKAETFVRGTFRFELVYPPDVRGKDCEWSINNPMGGVVDSAGVFTASGNPGVYIIKVKSNANRLYEAQAYVIVKDRL